MGGVTYEEGVEGIEDALQKPRLLPRKKVTQMPSLLRVCQHLITTGVPRS